MYDLVRDNKISEYKIKNAYRETLNLVLIEVDNFITQTYGKTVITADHGEMLGERPWPLTSKKWGHPRNFYTPELCKVPWYVTKHESRRLIEPDPPVPQETFKKQKVNERLRDLGYK
jgi:membrane-anchored protein YejM (alkaline phosphatase superfamily)